MIVKYVVLVVMMFSGQVPRINLLSLNIILTFIMLAFTNSKKVSITALYCSSFNVMTLPHFNSVFSISRS
ncbi:MAG: hypothetical protein JWQ40_3801 [Segetibacter sp.]|nr:hypothetical protein [Segetibacter sp.]